MVCRDLDLRIYAVQSSPICPCRCGSYLGFRGAQLTDILPLLTCADFLLVWQECVHTFH